MTTCEMACSSGRLPVSMVNALLRSPFAPELSVDKHKLQHSRKSMNFWGKLMPVASGVKVRCAELGGVTCEIHQPKTAPSNRVLLYFHGGGYCVGSPQSHRHIVSRLAKQCGMRAVVPDYRKSPEHPYPAPVEDAVAVYKTLMDQGIKPGNIYLAGDSAGGNLVLATLLSLKSLNQPLPAAASCISPWTDLSMSGATMASNEEADLILTPHLLHQFAEHYMSGSGGEGQNCNPGLSPLFADLTQLPPLLIQVGSEEVLLDDSVRLAAKAESCGVTVELQIWDRMQHVWHYTFPLLRDGRMAISEIALFFDRNQ
jgi:monoterpene epsilon-lactone hydrolase